MSKIPKPLSGSSPLPNFDHNKIPKPDETKVSHKILTARPRCCSAQIKEELIKEDRYAKYFKRLEKRSSSMNFEIWKRKVTSFAGFTFLKCIK